MTCTEFLAQLDDLIDDVVTTQMRADLKEHLKDLYDDITSGEIPGIRKVEELVIS